MPGASAFNAVDRLFRDEGGLCAVVAGWRAEVPQPSFDACCDRIAESKDVRVPRETLRRWVADNCNGASA